VRVTVEYISEAGANPTPEANDEDAKEGPVSIHWDFNPEQFDSATLARLADKRTAGQVFALTAETNSAPISVIDYDKSDYCSPEADSSCENHVVYKTVKGNLTTLKVLLK
jgi:hypothetical protein